MKQPRVSVLMPAYNVQQYIGEAIESILNQTYSNIELIVVNDASTDNTWDVVREYAKNDKRMVIHRNKKNLKLSKTLNKCIMLATGEYLARMDADDISLPQRIGSQVAFLEIHHDVGVVGATIEIIDHQGNPIGKREYHTSDQEIRAHIFKYSPFAHPVIMMRKYTLITAGLYNDYYNPAEDYELYFRMGAISKFGNLKETGLKYRVVAKSMTTGSMQRMELKTIEIRKEFSKNSHYRFTYIDNIYNILHLVSIYLLPAKVRLYIFNLLRNS